VRHRRALIAGLLIGAAGLTAGCSGGAGTDPSPKPTAPAPGSNPPSATSAAPSRSASDSPSGGASGSVSPSVPPEPTTTNTLPPPPEPTAPAPRTSGPLTAKDLPVPAGWRGVVRKGGAEQGYQGNGTWVHGRDPRYAAQDAITIGCASITRDDYPDPTAALEGTYGRKGATDTPGIGLALQFRSATDARTYYRQYVAQVRACTDPNGQVTATVVPSNLGLIDRRTYDGSTDWTEVAALHGARATFVILTDPGHRISRDQAEAILRAIPH
jgi:hypothetical protein